MQAESGPTAVERALPELHLAALAESFSLDKFIRKPKERRETYFGLISQTLDALTKAMGRPPSDRDLRDVVVMALTKDRSFLGFVLGRNGAKQLSTKDGGDDMVCAGAGAILCEYLKMNGET